MKNICILILILIISKNSIGQVYQEWANTYGGTANIADEGWRVLADKYGNVYAGGKCQNLISGFDYVTIKYNKLGVELWNRIYNGPANNQDFLRAMAIDNNGNVCVTGQSDSGNYTSCLTIKYDTNGTELWIARYNGSGAGYAIITDDSNNVYVTGEGGTIKYNKLGIRQWVFAHNGINTPTRAYSIKLDKNRNVYISGETNHIINETHYLTTKISSNGSLLWFKQYNGLANQQDISYSSDIDTLGNIYVTGRSYDGIVSGGNNYVTIKYSSGGIQQWIAKYNGTGNDEDIGAKIKVVNPNNIFVTGYSKGNDNSYDIATIKYNSSGIQQWVSRYSSNTGSLNDFGSDLDIDSAGNIYVAGQSSGDKCITIKYNAFGTEQWVQTYPGNGYLVTIDADKVGNIYVIGGNNQDIITIKYSQTPKIRLNLTLLFEGMYYQFFNQMIRKDTVNVYLRNTTFPYAIVDSAKGIIDSLSFSNIFSFINAPSGIYYIAVKHFNSIETWSKSGGESMTNDGLIYNYDFTTSASQAYGNNLKLKGSKYCIISGDVDGDGYIDASDASPIDNDSYISRTGRFLPTDLNGDNLVDADDMTIQDNNRNRGVIQP